MGLLKSALACASAALVSVSIVGCGGGGGGSDASPSPAAPAPAATVISAQPQNQAVLTGATASFSVSATGDSLGYQWRRNGANIAGATASTYTTPPVTHADHGAQYSVVVTGLGGSATSAAAQLTLNLSADQQIFESFMLAAGDSSYRLRWNLNYAGGQTSGVNYAYSEHGSLGASPLTAGPQNVTQSAPLNITSTLDITDPAVLVNSRPVRVLKDGVVLVVPGTQETRRVTYVGSDIRSQSLAADGVTVAYSTILNGYSQVALSGAVSSTPPEMAQWLNSFFSNAAILTPGAQYAAGASYVKYTATNEGDRYGVFDCGAATTGASVTPCYTGTTLAAALTTGIASASDGRTYLLADGVMTTVAGVPMWVANAQRPVSATFSSTVQYRTYFQMNGNVYTGALIRDGAVIGGTYYVSNPGAPAIEDRLTFFPYQLQFNKAAHDSLANALTL